MRMNINDIRRRNLRRLLEQYKSMAEFADKVDKDPSYLSQIIGKNPTKGIGSKIARSIEKSLEKPDGWLDREHAVQAHNPNTDILSIVIEATEEALQEENIQLSATKKSEVISLLYTLMHGNGTLDPEIIRKVIKLSN